MISWLIEQTIFLSLIVFWLLITKPFVTRFIGASAQYLQWTLLPLSILVSLITIHSPVQNTLSHYKVGQFILSAKQVSITATQNWLSMHNVLVFIWLSVVIGLLITLIIQHRTYIKSLQLTAIDQGTRQILISNQSQTKGQRDCIDFFQIYVSDKVNSPFVFGLFNTKLVLPLQFLEDFNQAQRDMIMAHELTHLRRGDLFWNSAAQLIVLLFWFNPIMWFAYGQFRQSQELACDQSVLASRPKSMRLAYAKALLLCNIAGPKIPLTFINYGAKNAMQERMLHLKTHKKSKVWASILSMLLLVPLTLSINLVIAGDKTGKQAEATSSYPTYRVEPIYPALAAEQAIEGSVILSFDINLDGTVSDVKVVDSNPKVVFDDASVIAVKQWLYQQPSKKLDDMLVQLDFVLESENSKKSGAKHDTTVKVNDNLM